MKNRSQPRYRTPERPTKQAKSRPLEFRRTHALGWWLRLAWRWTVLYTALPLLLLWLAYLALDPYRIHFAERPSGVTLDGNPVKLDSADGFDLARWAVGEHLLRYVDADGKPRAVRLHARLSDDGGLEISDRLVGVPKAEFVENL